MKLKKTLFFVISYLSLFFLFETCFRFAGVPYKVSVSPNETKTCTFDQELGWAYRPNINLIDTYYGKDITVYTDADGIRVESENFEFDYNKPTALFLGGSFTFGQGLEHNDSIAAQFESSCNSHYQAVNLGVQAYGTDQSLIALRKFVNTFDTSIIVYSYIPHHNMRNSTYNVRELYPTDFTLATKPLFHLKNNVLHLKRKPMPHEKYIHSYLFDFLYKSVMTAIHKFPPRSNKLTRAIILEMSKTAQEHNALFIVVDWWGTLAPIIQPNEYIHIINMKKEVESKTTKAWDADMRLADGWHPGKEACGVVAQTVFKYVNNINQ